MRCEGDVIVVTSEEVNAHLARVAESAGMTFDDFIKKGRSDELEGNARDQWLMWGPMNSDDD